jgi:hypothetical protein
MSEYRLLSRGESEAQQSHGCVGWHGFRQSARDLWCACSRKKINIRRSQVVSAEGRVRNEDSVQADSGANAGLI